MFPAARFNFFFKIKWKADLSWIAHQHWCWWASAKFVRLDSKKPSCSSCCTASKRHFWLLCYVTHVVLLAFLWNIMKSGSFFWNTSALLLWSLCCVCTFGVKELTEQHSKGAHNTRPKMSNFWHFGRPWAGGSGARKAFPIFLKLSEVFEHITKQLLWKFQEDRQRFACTRPDGQTWTFRW